MASCVFIDIVHDTLSVLSRNRCLSVARDVLAISSGSFSDFSQHLFMTLAFTQRGKFDGDSVLQQVQDHFADGVDLISIGMLQ